ncbi:histone protein [Streptomyces hirsutus]|uniref:Histone protein n=1 Tax=Streptomyces hirsutus TaxID=35620 RepID=A0ABZ1GM84_9ACTN|nr:histone protein [Streptomyces hirsutus]WSD06396.1 histone protein [Streptomyces hirsutus]
MEDQSKAALGAAVIGGYLLGRTGKGRLAITVATYLAGRRFGLEPRQLAAEGMRRLGEVPQFAQLQDQIRGEVLEAGRKAMTATANRSLGSLADTLSDRTARLTKPPRDEDVEDEYEGEEEETPDDEGAEYGDDEYEYEDEEEPGPEEEEEEEPGPEDEEEEEVEEEEVPERKPKKRPSGKKATAKKSAPAKKKAAEKKAPGKKATAKKSAPAKKTVSKKAAAKKTSPAKKTAASTSSSAKGTASKRTKRRR